MVSNRASRSDALFGCSCGGNCAQRTVTVQDRVCCCVEDACSEYVGQRLVERGLAWWVMVAGMVGYGGWHGGLYRVV